jgi:hypothetical protein
MTITAIAAVTYLTLFIIALLTPARDSKSERPAPSKPAMVVQIECDARGQ